MRISDAATSAFKVPLRFCYGQAGPRRGFHRAQLLIGKFRFPNKLYYECGQRISQRVWPFNINSEFGLNIILMCPEGLPT